MSGTAAQSGGLPQSAAVVIVGAGVLGTAIAARLAETSASVVVIERHDDVAEEASKGNAGIATTFYAPPGTLEARLITASWPRWEELCERLDVPYRRCGAVMAAVDDEQATQLGSVAATLTEAGSRVEIITAAEAREREPLLSERCTGALLLPGEGIIDPMRLTWSYASLAVANGARIVFDCTVTGFTREGDRVVAVETTRGTIRCDAVVNAAGLGAGVISALAGGEELTFWARKGQYWILDRQFGSRLRHAVLPVPMAETRGVQVVPTTNGTALLGPDAHEGTDTEDRGTDAASLEAIVAVTQALVPSVTTDLAIKTYAANRPASTETSRLRRDPAVPNLVHVTNRSSGVSCSPAVADLATELIGEIGIDVADRIDAVRRLPALRRLRDDPEPETLTDIDQRYAQVVCACEQVTAAEIAAALSSPVPARSIEGVRKRTRATGGRCQGALCSAGVSFLCSMHLGLAPEDVRVGSDRATIGVGRVG